MSRQKRAATYDRVWIHMDYGTVKGGGAGAKKCNRVDVAEEMQQRRCSRGGREEEEEEERHARVNQKITVRLTAADGAQPHKKPLANLPTTNQLSLARTL